MLMLPQLTATDCHSPQLSVFQPSENKCLLDPARVGLAMETSLAIMSQPKLDHWTTNTTIGEHPS